MGIAILCIGVLIARRAPFFNSTPEGTAGLVSSDRDPRGDAGGVVLRNWVLIKAEELIAA